MDTSTHSYSSILSFVLKTYVANPKCKIGCGKWTRPLKKNPAHKGRWTAPLIDNPAYRGPWTPRKIPNPDFYVETSPAGLLPAAGIGFELWTVQGGILFDNILLTNDVRQADEFAAATWTLKYDVERLDLEAELAARGISDEMLLDDEEMEEPIEDEGVTEPFAYLSFLGRGLKTLLNMQRLYQLFFEELRANPVHAITAFPMMAFNCLLGLIILAILTNRFSKLVLVMMVPRKKQAKGEEIKVSEDVSIKQIQKSGHIDMEEDLTLTTASQAQTGAAMRRTPSKIPRPISPFRRTVKGDQ